MFNAIGFFLTGTVLAYLFWQLFAGKYEGHRIERSIRPKIGPYRFHLHHWISGVIGLGLLFYFKFYNPLLMGLLVGSILQGLRYRDRFIVFYRDEDFEKIYARFRKSPDWAVQPPKKAIHRRG